MPNGMGGGFEELNISSTSKKPADLSQKMTEKGAKGDRDEWAGKETGGGKGPIQLVLSLVTPFARPDDARLTPEQPRM